jgi:hypothetical protein
MPHQVAKAPPAIGLGAIHRRAHAGGAEAKQCFGRFPIMPGDECHGGDRRKLPHKAGDGRQRFSVTAVYRYDHGINPAPPGHVQRFAE